MTDDGHTLATVLPEIEAQIGAPASRVLADRGYRGHNAPPDMRFKVDGSKNIAESAAL